MKAVVSVLILTKNEEAFIERAIRSVSWADEVIVVDSESTDRTRAIASSLGAKVHVQPWLGWLKQKAKALELAKHDWVFSLDADEIVSARLSKSIIAALEGNANPDDGYVVDRCEEFLGRLLPNMRRKAKRNTFVRLFNKTRSGWDPEVIIHEEVRCPGKLIPLRGELLHWRNYTVGQQLDTFNRNSDLEARMLIHRKSGGHVLIMVVKPFLRFAWIYIRCGYWRLGTRGFIVASMHAFAEFLRHAKVWEHKYTEPTPNPPLTIIKQMDLPPIVDDLANTQRTWAG